MKMTNVTEHPVRDPFLGYFLTKKNTKSEEEEI